MRVRTDPNATQQVLLKGQGAEGEEVKRWTPGNAGMEDQGAVGAEEDEGNRGPNEEKRPGRTDQRNGSRSVVAGKLARSEWERRERLRGEVTDRVRHRQN